MKLPDPASRWIKGLPLRWFIGGIGLGLVWSAFSVFQGGLTQPVGGLGAGLVRLFGLIILPLGILGFAWGCTERVAFEHWSREGDERLQEAIGQSVSRQIWKAATCGLLFGIFTYELGIFRSFRPWDDEANIYANLYGVLGFALLGVPVGWIVGTVSKHNLKQKLLQPAVMP